MTPTWHQRGQFEHKFQKVVRCYDFFSKMSHFDPKLTGMHEWTNFFFSLFYTKIKKKKVKL